MNSEVMLKGGMNLYGYSYEFNVNYFLQTISTLIELPDLAFDLMSSKIAFYKELDIAYYTKTISPNINDIISLLRCSACYKIFKNTIAEEKCPNFEIKENTLILGEVKLRFPKIKYKANETKKRESLEAIIQNLLTKAEFFYKLYKDMNLVDMSKIKNIQLILFYDTIQLKNISLNVIDYIFKQVKDKLNFFSNFETNFFIVYNNLFSKLFCLMF